VPKLEHSILAIILLQL